MAARGLRLRLGISSYRFWACNHSNWNSKRDFSVTPVPIPIPTQLEKVGFIGLGNMGSHMASNLISAGYKVTLHDINQNALKDFSEKGVPVAETPYQLSQSSDVIITMLPSSSHVMEVFTGTNGLLTGTSEVRPWLFIDSSTIDPQTSRRISRDISSCHLKENEGFTKKPLMLDAPVSGGVPAAQAGTLTFMVGGLEEAYIAAKPLLLAMGKQTIYCGGPGNGSVAKICNNLAMAISMIGVSEALSLGQNLGVKASVLTNVFNSSSARCWSSDSYNPVPGVMQGVPSSRNYEGGFTSKLMAKDLGLATASVAEVGLNCLLTADAHNIYTRLCEDGHESKDFSCVFRYCYDGKDDK
ncbi:3-hydroxyisobutyrate dehydrogenase [Rhynchospora pubera]|uniref:3-hydroxyisobutyrate dehydrogenase n=1 Tax=Rhynchospora pubera TaxID=906938 RepID=A0AAV8ENL8_9POAL|nr:3-hydroxyisobutyrate dehydrogenase [Rhynchospora pubera]KAJ4779853.1 3-hydroxyisobutyrate dehydrogenase [Rhynchospora pubera]